MSQTISSSAIMFIANEADFLHPDARMAHCCSRPHSSAQPDAGISRSGAGGRRLAQCQRQGLSLQMHGIAAAFHSKVVIEATDYTDFAHAMRLKLLRELEPAISWGERGIPLTEQAVASHAKWFVMECPH